MKFNVDKTFWDKSNLLAKGCFFIGVFFIELGMRLSGLESKGDKNG